MVAQGLGNGCPRLGQRLPKAWATVAQGLGNGCPGLGNGCPGKEILGENGPAIGGGYSLGPSGSRRFDPDPPILPHSSVHDLVWSRGRLLHSGYRLFVASEAQIVSRASLQPLPGHGQITRDAVCDRRRMGETSRQATSRCATC